ncbi:SulP family inorganic anion transporter [Prosthecomicrobium sp. N25]|uniref:SulP family inorganic anion transporter n=1 Tax=Prosthecomicrobium sp. N25 TaxID=3129254 RepID=UPI003077C94A
MNRTAPRLPEDSFADLFTPKLITTLREGYDVGRLVSDVIAGLTVAIVALPLAMGIAIASGTTPDKGLFTAVVAGFIISALGGSRFQIGGPTAAFIVVVYRTIETQGYDGLVLATFLAGLILVAVGYLKLGTYIKYIPYPVTIGFTAGIGITIFVSQVADLLGLSAGKLPGEFVAKVEALWHALPTLNASAVALSALSLAVILGLRRTRPKWPGFLIAVVLASVVTALFQLDAVTIGSKYGEIPRMPPSPELPALSFAKIKAVLPDAITIAVLAGIESLLSAVVADGMTGRRHRSNCELVAQGFANVASALFGGLPATGAIARTATNIRSGSTGPVSGVLHAVFLLVFMLVAAPLASYVPLAVLAAILAIVAWNMAEVHVVGRLLVNSGWGDRTVLLSTMLLTVFYDLTVGIEVGVVLAAMLFMHHMAEAVQVEAHGNVDLIDRDRADDPERTPYDPSQQIRDDVVVYRINGPFFFGAANQLTTTLSRIGTRPKRLVLDFAGVPLVDSTGAATLRGVVADMHKRGADVVLAGMSRPVRRSLVRFGIHRPHVSVLTAPSVAAALERIDHEPLAAE